MIKVRFFALILILILVVAFLINDLHAEKLIEITHKVPLDYSEDFISASFELRIPYVNGSLLLEGYLTLEPLSSSNWVVSDSMLSICNEGYEAVTITYGEPLVDLIFIDSYGNEYYRWSEGKVFPLVLISKKIAPQTCFTKQFLVGEEIKDEYIKRIFVLVIHIRFSVEGFKPLSIDIHAFRTNQALILPILPPLEISKSVVIVFNRTKNMINYGVFESLKESGFITIYFVDNVLIGVGHTSLKLMEGIPQATLVPPGSDIVIAVSTLPEVDSEKLIDVLERELSELAVHDILRVARRDLYDINNLLRNLLKSTWNAVLIYWSEKEHAWVSKILLTNSYETKPKETITEIVTTSTTVTKVITVTPSENLAYLMKFLNTLLTYFMIAIIGGIAIAIILVLIIIKKLG